MAKISVYDVKLKRGLLPGESVSLPYKAGDAQGDFDATPGKNLLITNGGKVVLVDGTSTYSLTFNVGDITLTWNSAKHFIGDIDDVRIVVNNFIDIGGLAIQDNSIGTSKLQDGAVTGPKLQDGTVTPAKLADLAVTAAKIAALAIAAGHISVGAVETDKLAALAVTAAKIANGAVGTTQLADLNVTTGKLADLSVTNAKLAADAVTADKIAAGAVGADEIATGAVGTDELAAGAVTTAKIGDSQVTAAKINRTGLDADSVDGIEGASIARLDSPQQFSKKKGHDPITVVDAATMIWDANNGNIAIFRPSAAGRVVQVDNLTAGVYTLIIYPTVNGANLSWPAGWKWFGGSAPAQTALSTKKDVVSIIHDGTDIMAAMSINA